MKKTILKKKFKFLEHTADIKFQAFGRTLEQVFKNSALAMFNSMSKDKVAEKKIKKIKVKGKDLESLLYNFLEEFLFLFDSERFLLSKIKKIKISEKNKKFSLEAEISGDEADNYQVDMHIKAVTYNEMFVHKDKKTGNWKSQVVLDV